MANTATNLGTDTLRRLCRQGHLQEAGRFLNEQFPALMKEEDFSDVFLTSFIPNLVKVAEHELHTVAETVSQAWLVVDAYKCYPDEPWLSQLKRLVLPAVDWARGQEVAATLALRCPSLPFAEEYRSREAAVCVARGGKAGGATGPVIRMERQIAVTEYRLGKWEASSTGSARRTLLRSPQEREFLKAARAFFVGREALPNVRLSNFIDIDCLASDLPSDIRRYARLAEADVLIATPLDFDPIGVIELDSAFHDTPVAKLRDAMKGRLLEMAGIPFVRLRAESPGSIHADNFYSLLQDQWLKFEAFKPQGWRERDNHARMLPAA